MFWRIVNIFIGIINAALAFSALINDTNYKVLFTNSFIAALCFAIKDDIK